MSDGGTSGATRKGNDNNLALDEQAFRSAMTTIKWFEIMNDDDG